MTEQEKQEAIRDLQFTVNGAVASLVNLREVAEELGTLHAFPVFEDVSVKMAMDAYKELRVLRGY